MKWYIKLGIVIILAAMFATVLYMYPGFAPTPSESFSSDGHLMWNNPGFKPDTWYLSYEKPGNPGLYAELAFDTQSFCATDGGPMPCDMTPGWQGKPVHVEGFLRNGVVHIRDMHLVIETGVIVRLYYYNPDRDDGPGNIHCSRMGLVPVERVLPSTENIEAETIKLLLRSELSQEEKNDGLVTDFPLPGVSLESAELKDAVLTLTFDDPQHKTSSGSCRSSILWYQVEATAKQFPWVRAVRFLPEDLFQP